MVKTVTLTGSEVEVSDLGGQNAAVKNLGDGSIYASIYPGIEAGADNVVEIPAGGGEVVLDANGTVYLLGTGKAQCTGTPYATPNFKMPSSSTSGGGGSICGKFIIKSTDSDALVHPTHTLIQDLADYSKTSAAFARALANETGLELQSNGIAVLKRGEEGAVGFYISNLTYIFLTSNGSNGITNANYQYLLSSATAYYMDVAKTAKGTIAFGFRPSTGNPNYAFVLTKNGAGRYVVLTTYSGAQWATEDKPNNISKMSMTLFQRTTSVDNDMIVLEPYPDINNGGFFQDLYVVRLDPKIDGTTLNWGSGTIIKVDNKTFLIVQNRKYDYNSTAVLAIPLD